MPLVRIADLNGPPEEVTRCVHIAKKLSAMYDDFILLEKPEEERAPGIHASELYPCMRRPVYSLLRVDRKPNVPKFWKQRFKVGTAIHEMMQSDFHRMAVRSQKRAAMRVASKFAEDINCYFTFEDELPVGPEYQELARYYDIHSHCDGVFTFYDKDTDEMILRVGLEIKTEAPEQYEKLKEPKPEHLCQATVYMACLDLPLLWFFYMNKGNQNNTPSTAPYLISFQPEIWRDIALRCEEVHRLAMMKTIPERTEGIWCEWCPWSYVCQPNNLMKVFQDRDKKNARDPFRLGGL